MGTSNGKEFSADQLTNRIRRSQSPYQQMVQFMSADIPLPQDLEMTTSSLLSSIIPGGITDGKELSAEQDRIRELQSPYQQMVQFMFVELHLP